MTFILNFGQNPFYKIDPGSLIQIKFLGKLQAVTIGVTSIELKYLAKPKNKNIFLKLSFCRGVTPKVGKKVLMDYLMNGKTYL